MNHPSHFNFHDFNITKFIDPKPLTNSNVVFDEGEPIRKFYSYKLVVNDGILNRVAIENLMETMKMMGMQVAQPRQVFIQRSRFQNLRQEPPRTHDMKFETAVKLPRQKTTKKNIVNKINIKLEGLNYKMGSSEMHPQKFGGGFVFVKRSSDVYGPVLQELIHQIIKQAQSKRSGELKKILIYFNGITEGQYGMINEKYSVFNIKACKAIHPTDFRPDIIIVALSKTNFVL
ncbi:hypothetical protein CRE_07587 [Caenorhabditis remanei]|uniref:Piwi domain-containing protein n=1 Tax=Caenorhabditis remanei TaxID=31234 RepID=E3MP54_CAERE|nr:hypothetical protein CRE_07587 [Caenorhabditis remanei]